MITNITCAVALVLLIASTALAQATNVTNDPFPTPIAATDGVIAVKFTEFATIPDFNSAAQYAPRRAATMARKTRLGA